MLNIDTGEDINTLYKMIEIKGGKRIEKFKTTDIKRALRFQKWYIKQYKQGLLMEIIPEKKIYNWKEKKVNYTFEEL